MWILSGKSQSLASRKNFSHACYKMNKIKNPKHQCGELVHHFEILLITYREMFYSNFLKNLLCRTGKSQY
jgi:hypothetical protein